MPKISLFSEWLVESVDPDPVRLFELGLWTGAGVQWEVDVRLVFNRHIHLNPPCGNLQIIYDLASWQAAAGHTADQLRYHQTWTLYPTSFGPVSGIILEAWQQWQVSRDQPSFTRLAELMQAHLHRAVQKYSTDSRDFPKSGLASIIPARQLSPMWPALLPPTFARPGPGPWYPFNTAGPPTGPAQVR